MNRVPQLPYVSGPGVLPQLLEGPGSEAFHARGRLASKLRTEVLDEKFQVIGTFAEWRQMKMHNVQAVEQVQPKAARQRLVREVPVRGRQNANV